MNIFNFNRKYIMIDGNIVGALISIGAGLLINNATIYCVSKSALYIRKKIKQKNDKLRLTKKFLLSTSE